jgi:hypothetical protein
MMLTAHTHRAGWLGLAVAALLAAPGTIHAADAPAPSPILVEIFLANDQKPHLDAIKREFSTFQIEKVRAKFFAAGHPPENIAIGRNVPAPVARLAIRLAVTYNRDVKLLLPEKRLAADYIAIGTSIFDESFQVPISPDDLQRLADPALTTDQFHALYRNLTKEELPAGSR